ncbi:MAG: flagellar basal body P-ring protein FlgI [Anaerohalosphaeraceae bacterium]|jgi:flagellar basal body P-ring protein FlgI
MTQRIFAGLTVIALLLAVTGCPPAPEPQKPVDTTPNYDVTIGQLGEMYQHSAVPVRGFGIVAGLPGTGSSECPPELREVLRKTILANVKSDASINPDAFINGLDTAVVEIYGTIPPIASRGDRFDLKVVPFSSTQTTSLAGGTLYPCDLKDMRTLVRYDQFAPVLARGAGPIFIDNTEVNKTGAAYVLGGGGVTQGVRLAIGLKKPDFVTAAAVRNRINERFGPKVANAVSPGEIEFSIPERYINEKEKFLIMVNQLYMAEDFDLRTRRIDDLTAKLALGTDILTTEYALDAIGRPALDKLAPLLENEDPKIRFHAARCMLSIGDDRALPVLRAFINDGSSKFRLPAIDAVGFNAKRDHAIQALTDLLGDDDFKARFAAYEHLLRLQDISVSRTIVSDKFFIDQIARRGAPVIYVSRARAPKIVLFGAPIDCVKNLFIESDNRDIVLNAPPGGKYVNVMRKLPNQPRLMGPLIADFEISDIIRTLCENPSNNAVQLRKGLGASYSDVIALLEKMAKSKIVNANFIAGDSVSQFPFVQAQSPTDR